MRDLRGLPALAELVREFAARVRSHGGEIRGLATYVPNEVHLQRYRPGSFGITPLVPEPGRWGCEEPGPPPVVLRARTHGQAAQPDAGHTAPNAAIRRV